MENTEKYAIQAELKRLVEATSGNAVAVKVGVSAATVSNVLTNKWERVSDDMWRKFSAFIRSTSQLTPLNEWVMVESKGYHELTETFTDAQSYSLVMAVCGNAGSGKSAIAKCYADTNSNVYLLSCNDFWNKKLFLQELLRSMGRNATGYSVGEMVSDIVDVLKKTISPLIIIDEADKLSDQVLYFFITLYNQLEDHCGIVLMATDFLEKRVRTGLRLNKKGYKEVYSRIGRKFIPLATPDAADITSICVANGIEDKGIIKNIINDSEGDLRRVKRKVFATNKKRVRTNG